MDEDRWEDMDQEYEGVSTSSFKRHIEWKTIISIITGFGWLIFLVIWLFFYASDHTVYQNLGVILASMMALFLVNGTAWSAMGRGSKWRSAFTSITGFILGIFLVIWLFYYASDYTLLENIGVFLISVLIVGALNSLIWIPKSSSVGWRAAVSAVSGIGWIIFLVYWLFVLSSAYNIYQNIAIFIVSILVLGMINTITWVTWGLQKAF
ncbi:MAG: hypothetical protein KGY66_02025 [Candidatus Thermoplasmatota archaeon]|nr:hypothetical protein [Candidatus Thermoplasmatota archaeon]MBS3789675.1 hypothetical protein [Candidatus Thermoplasmatota archaeon]